MSIIDYSTTAASNTSLFPENMAPSAVNDGMRQVQADIRAGTTIKYATIAAMTAITKSKLTDNDEFFIENFATTGDEGGGYFYWDSASTDTADGGSILASDEAGTGRFIRKTSYYTPEMFGGKGDGSTDDTTAVQAAMDKGGVVIFAAGKTYMYEPGADKGFNSNNILMGHGTIKLHFPSGAPVVATIQQILRPKNYANVDNVSFYDITLDGDRDNITWSGVTSGDGNAHGLALWGTQDVRIDNVKVKNCWTDGYYLAYTHSSIGTRRNCSNVRIGSIYAYNCGRQGMSVISCDGLTMNSLYVDTVDRTTPKAAIDLEPNGSPDQIININIGTIYSTDTGGGVIIAGVTNVENVNIGQITCKNVSGIQGLQITSCKNVNIGQAYIYQTQGSFQALNIDDYENIHIGAFTSELDASATGSASAVQINDNASLNTNINLRIDYLNVNGARASGFNQATGTEVNIGYGIVADCNRGAVGGAGWYFQDKARVGLIETLGTAQTYSLLIADSDVVIESANLTSGATADISYGSYTPSLGNIRVNGQSVTRIDRTYTLASGATQALPSITSNKGHFTIIPNDRPTYGGSFGAFSTEVPLDQGAGSKLSFQTATGGSTSDDVLRIFPSDANTISILNNTSTEKKLRVIIEPYI